MVGPPLLLCREQIIIENEGMKINLPPFRRKVSMQGFVLVLIVAHISTVVAVMASDGPHKLTFWSSVQAGVRGGPGRQRTLGEDGERLRKGQRTVGAS